MTAFRSELARAMRLGFLLTVPSTVGLMLLAEPIISLLYQHGKFTPEQAQLAAGALRFYAIGLTGYSALKVLVNAFYALDRRKTPMVVSFIAVGLNLLFNWLFTFRLGWGYRGLAFSTGLIATCNFILLYAMMRSQLKGLDSTRTLITLAKVCLACVPLAAVCLASTHYVLVDWATQGFMVKFVAVFATIGLAGGSFAAAGHLLKIPEFNDLRGALLRRLRR
jgi:putative peptidoglycan lipid II flippase